MGTPVKETELGDKALAEKLAANEPVQKYVISPQGDLYFTWGDALAAKAE